MFKVNNKDIKTNDAIGVVLVSFIVNFGHYFTPSSSVSIVNFQQVNAGCVSSICFGMPLFLFILLVFLNNGNTRNIQPMVKVSLKIAPFQIYPRGVTISNSEPKKIYIYPRNQKMFHSKKAIINAEKYLIREEHSPFFHN